MHEHINVCIEIANSKTNIKSGACDMLSLRLFQLAKFKAQPNQMIIIVKVQVHVYTCVDQRSSDMKIL